MAASIAHVLNQLPSWTSDAVLLERYIQQRDEAAFAGVVGRHGAMVLRLCRRILGDVHAAEDAFQATFLILARKAHSLKQPESLPAWLYGVARRVALKARMKSVRRPLESLDDALPDPRPDPLMQLSVRELLDILDVEVQRLSAAQRSVVVLCCLEGHTQEDAARILGCTPGSIKGRLERGRQRLHARLQRRGIALSAALAIVVVARDRVSAHVPGLLLHSTVRAGLHGGIGNSASALALANSVLQAMFLTKLTGVMAVVLTIALVASTTIALIYPDSATEAPEDKKPIVAVAPKEANASKPQARTDALGDPLPDGAIARLGTVRFRHGGRIERMVFAADGKHLISQGGDGVRIWDTATGKEHRHLTSPPNENWTQATDLSADGKLLAVVHGQNSAIDFWDVHQGKKIDSFGQGDYSLVCLSPDGKWAAVCAKSSGIELWDIARREKMRSWKAQKWQVWFFVFSADSRRLLTGDPQGILRIWEVPTGRQLQEFTIPNYSVQRLSSLPLSPDSKLLAVIEDVKPTQPGGAAKWRGRVSVWDTATGKQIQQLPKEPAPIDESGFMALAFTADSKRLLTSGPAASLHVWDPRTGNDLRKVPFDPRHAHVLALSHDGTTLAAASGMAIHLLDLPSGRAYQPPEGLAIAISNTYCAALAPDGQTAITDSWEHAPLVWDANSGRVRQTLGRHKNYLSSLQISRDGKTLYSHDTENVLRLWDLSHGEERSQGRLNFVADKSREMVVSPDNHSLFLAGADGVIHQLDAATGKEHNHFQGPKYLWGMACRPDGRSLVGWSGDRKIRVWDVTNGHLEREYTVPENIKGKYGLAGPNGGVVASFYSAALSPDGRLLAMGSQLENDAPKRKPKPEYTLIIKDLNTGRDVVHCDRLPSGLDVLAFSPDGRMLAWSGDFMDPSIHLLEVASGRERRCLVGHRGQVRTLQFSATGERLLSASVDTTALVWDLGVGRARSQPTVAELETLWADLAGEDAERAYQAICRLAAAPKAALPLLRKHLHPVPVVDEKHLARRIADLDSDDFAARQRASEELAKLGELALAAYREALDGKPSLETRRRLDDLREKAHRAWWDASGERLRVLRAIEALELAGTKEARELLAALAAGTAGARLTEEAKAALVRLANGAASARR